MKKYLNEKNNFKVIIDNIEVIKVQFVGVITSFSCFEEEQKLIYIQKIRKQVYSLKFPEWQRDRIWEYLNGDLPIEKLKKIVGANK